MKHCRKIREIFSVKYLWKMWYFWTKNMNGVTEKIEILHRGQSDPALQKTSKQLFSHSLHSWWKYFPNISIPWKPRKSCEVIFFIKLWTRPNYFMHILPPACWNCYSFRSCCCFNSTAFQIHVKSERNFQISYICINILRKWWWRETFIKDSFSMGIDP